MGRHGVRLFFFLLAFVLAASAQSQLERFIRHVRVDVQLYLPSGEKPTRPIVMQVRSDDWSTNRLVSTSSNGWASLELEEHAFVTLLVQAEEGVYATTSVSFSPSEGR